MRPAMSFIRWGLVGVACVVGCGGAVVGTSATDAGGDTASPDASAYAPALDATPDSPVLDGAPDARPDAGDCVASPKVGDPCVAGQKSCDKVDACCVATVACSPSTGKWVSVELDCACRGIPCGDQTCTGTQYCRSTTPGPMPLEGGVTLFYECKDFPKACERQWTCDCLNSVPDPACFGPSPGACRMENDRPRQSCMGI